MARGVGGCASLISEYYPNLPLDAVSLYVNVNGCKGHEPISISIKRRQSEGRRHDDDDHHHHLHGFSLWRFRAHALSRSQNINCLADFAAMTAATFQASHSRNSNCHEDCLSQPCPIAVTVVTVCKPFGTFLQGHGRENDNCHGDSGVLRLLRHHRKGWVQNDTRYRPCHGVRGGR